MIDLREECEGYYKIEAVKADGSRRLLADWFPNLILDAGLDRMGSNSDYLNSCQVGSGSTAPVATQTTLVARVAGTSTKPSDTSANSGSEPYFARRTVTFRFSQGVATGVLAEVGVGWAITGSLFSRALILDALGNPTTITVLSDESLDVTYELRMYVWTGENSGVISLRGESYDSVQKSANAAAWSLSGSNLNAGTASGVGTARAFTGSISAAIAGSPSGADIGPAEYTVTEYTAGSLYRVINLTAGLSQWNNASGIGAIRLTMGWGAWQLGFTPNIQKTSSDILTFQIRHSWGRRV